MARLPKLEGWFEGLVAMLVADALMVGMVGWVCGWWG